MGDLYVGCAIVATAAIGVFLLTHYATRSLSLMASNFLAFLTVLLIVCYIREFWYDAKMARWLPFTNLIVVGNWLPLMAAVLAALAYDHLPAPRFRKYFSAAALAFVSIITLVYPLLGTVPVCGNHWDTSGVCRQTTDFTCSPAAAATLLRMHGIATTEQEMANLCLTRHGTSWPGLYRGLKLKTAGTPWDVEVVDCSAEELPQYAETPLILSVGLVRNARVDANFSREYGWQPGVNHSVLMLGLKQDAIQIADPSQPFATETWNRETLQLLWRGLAIRLVPRR